MKRTVKKDGKTLEYTLICSVNRKNILLQALPQKAVRVYAPKSARLKEMDELVLSRWDWILEMHEELDRAEKKLSFDPANGVLFEGKRIPVEIIRSVRNETGISDGKMTVKTNTQDLSRIESQIKSFLCAAALERIRERVNEYAPGIGKAFGRITVREQKSRWGSCSAKNNLNFNWKLILAPKEALEYVVIHELCHLIHFNHSEKFWQEVSSRMPNYDIWRKWLKNHGRELHL